MRKAKKPLKKKSKVEKKDPKKSLDELIEDRDFILQGSNVGILIADNKLRMRLFNIAWEKVFLPEGADKKKFYGASFLDALKIAQKRKFHSLQSRKKTEAVLNKILKGSTQTHRLEYVAPNGNWYASHVRPIIVGKLAGFMLTHDNITDQKIWEQSLIQEKNNVVEQSKRKTFFLANLSHELKTPLNSIIGFSELLKEQLSSDEFGKKYIPDLENIRAASSHLHSIVLRILDMAKIQSGTIILKEEIVSVTDLLNSAILMVKPSAMNRVIDMPSGHVLNKYYLKCDKNLAMEVLINLLMNSLKYSGADTSIKINCGLDSDNNLTIQVVDQGHGMNEKEVKIAMEPFGQNLRTPNDRHMGLGLGLPFSVQVMEAHGGSLLVNSKKGEGTSIQILFPATRLTIK